MRTSLAVGVAALILLSGCEWLGIGSTPTSSEKARPGAERQVSVTNSLPAARAAGGPEGDDVLGDVHVVEDVLVGCAFVAGELDQ